MILFMLPLICDAAFDRIDYAIVALERAQALANQKKISQKFLSRLETLELKGDPHKGMEVHLLSSFEKNPKLLQLQINPKGERGNYLLEKRRGFNEKRSSQFTKTSKVAKAVLLAVKNEKLPTLVPFQKNLLGLSIGEEQDSLSRTVFSVDVHSENSTDILRYWLLKDGKILTAVLVPGGPTLYPDEEGENELYLK